MQASAQAQGAAAQTEGAAQTQGPAAQPSSQTQGPAAQTEGTPDAAQTQGAEQPLAQTQGAAQTSAQTRVAVPTQRAQKSSRRSRRNRASEPQPPPAKRAKHNTDAVRPPLLPSSVTPEADPFEDYLDMALFEDDGNGNAAHAAEALAELQQYEQLPASEPPQTQQQQPVAEKQADAFPAAVWKVRTQSLTRSSQLQYWY